MSDNKKGITLREEEESLIAEQGGLDHDEPRYHQIQDRLNEIQVEREQSLVVGRGTLSPEWPGEVPDESSVQVVRSNDGWKVIPSK